jgi:hypothetical protein
VLELQHRADGSWAAESEPSSAEVAHCNRTRIRLHDMQDDYFVVAIKFGFVIVPNVHSNECK